MTAPQPPQDPPAATQPPKKKRPVTQWFLMGIGGVAVVMTAVAVAPHPAQPAPTQAAAAPSPTTTTAAQPTLPQHHVVYRVTGAASPALVHHDDGTSAGALADVVALPWIKEFEFATDKPAVMFQLQAEDPDRHTFSCTITIDGTLVKTATSRGAFAVADCDTVIQNAHH